MKCSLSKLPFLFGILVLLAACGIRVDLEDDPRQPPKSAVQTIYQAGAPHTDRSGAPLSQHVRGRSFFPIGIYHGLHGRHFGREYSFQQIAEAGFNTVHFWEGQRVGAVIDGARRHGLMLIPHHPTDPEIRKLAKDPAILAWYLDEEPTQFYDPKEQPKYLARFKERYAQIRSLGARQPIMVVDRRPMLGRMTSWDRWATSGDVSSHFTYPFVGDVIHTLGRRRSIAAGLSRAVALNAEKKPVWFVAQAFSGTLGWRMPTPRLLRAMTYTAIIHGATGIIYFGLDSFVMRDGNVIGMAPNPLADYGKTPDFDGRGNPPLIANPNDLAGSRALWRMMPALITELKTLSPAILSPTARRAYSVEVEGEQLSEFPIRTILKKVADEYVLLAVNLDTVPLTASVNLGGQPEQVRSPLNPSTEPVPTPRGLTLSFDGFGVHVVRFRLPPQKSAVAG